MSLKVNRDLLDNRIGLVEEVDIYKSADCTCHLIHQSAWLSEIYVLCILSYLCNID